MENIRKAWSRSKIYRILVVTTALLALLRVIAGWFYWVGEPEEMTIPNDLLIYLEAANSFGLRQDLYMIEDLSAEDWSYQYPPAYALAFTPFLWLPTKAVMLIHMLLHLIAYGTLYIQWERIFRRMGLDQVTKVMAWTLPVWLIFASFWNWFTWLNIGIFIALCATLLLEAIMDERLGWSVLWLSIILQTKPQWAFAAAIPLLLGRWRFFLKLIVLTIVVYVAIMGITILIAGPAYGWQQYADYIQHLQQHRDNFPWRGPDQPFLGYNHSVTQVTVYLLGVTPGMLWLATGIKLLLLAPLAAVSVRCLLRPAKSIGRDRPQLSLELAFAMYSGAFIWLDSVNEIFLSIIIVPYLSIMLNQRGVRILLWTTFLVHALAEIWLLIASIGPTSNDGYALWNPSIHIPFGLIILLVLYALLVKRLWDKSTYASQNSQEVKTPPL